MSVFAFKDELIPHLRAGKFRGDRMGVGEQWTDCHTKLKKHRARRKVRRAMEKATRRAQR